MPKHRLTKIICTLGPASSAIGQIAALAGGGMSIARINLSHGSAEEHAETIRLIKTLNSKRAIPVGILLDTKGAEIRTGDVQSPIVLKKGDEVLFYSQNDLSVRAEEKVISVNYDGFADDVRETDRILIDNGELALDILRINKDGTVLARARQDGEIGSRRHVNLPGADIDLPSITEKDWQDIALAAEQNVDFVALSFVRTAEEITEVREFLRKRKATTRIISKIETAQAVERIGDIIRASDGIMIARGDLGAEVPFETLPSIQDEIIVRCSDAGKPVIVATHMLESMKDHPIPTRAEMTDVAHAAMELADCTMLSGETATGKHPALALEAMDRLLRNAEEHISRFSETARDIRIKDDKYDARSDSAVSLAKSTGASAILVFTRSGKTAQQISKFRPVVPIIACTNDPAVQRHMTLLYGVYPLLIPFADAETTIGHGMKAALENGFAQKGDKLILVSDVPKELADWSIQQRVL
ncbi:MAG: pyruvate kinase [Candidatus Peribacteraceae bacterium]|nr:pyruvate kinase [Candidatus Peribacteraceae bacterium]